MKLTSNNFSHHSSIPPKLAFCRIDPETHITLASNRSPHFSWCDLPEGTRSLVLICHDPDAPSQGDDVNQEGRRIPPELPRVDFYHWLMANIPTTITEITEGLFSDGVTAHGKADSSPTPNIRQGLNSYTDWFAGDKEMEGLYHGYDGPCPPWNDSIVHHYIFTLYALDLESLELSEQFRADELLKAIEGHTLDKASITGIYSLNPDLPA